MKFLKCSLFISILIFITQSCEKEYSLEDSSGTAEGTLKADGFGDCLPSAVNGIYKIDSTLGADNFIEVQVNFTVAGNYTIVSDTINGYSFKAADNIASPGLYSVRLYGTGKPLNAGVNNFTISFGGSQCDIAVTVVSAATNIGVFTLGGSPGNCSSAVPNGTYTEDIELNSSNTVTITVNVTALGVYTLAAASSNGMFFTGSGTFTTFGPQSVILTGGGTPSSAGTINVTAISLSSTCTFNITVLPAAAVTDFITCEINGVPATFNVNARAVLDTSTGFPGLIIGGEATASPDPSITFGVIKQAGNIDAGSYNVNQLASGIIAGCYYYDATGVEYSAETDPLNQAQSPAFTIDINIITATRVIGTFNGPLKDSAGTSIKTITVGAFNVPIQ